MGIFRQLRLKTPVALALQLACLGSAAIASGFDMSVQVKSATQQVSAKYAEEQPSATKPHPRPVFTSESKETLLVSWKATNNAKQATFQDVLIHCFVVAEKEPGQASLPNLKDAVQESALTMDFKPGDSATGEFSLMVDKPGAYLVRIETQNVPDSHGHEHYAALDLVRK